MTNQLMSTAAQPAFRGTAEQQQLAERVYELMVLQGAFFPENVPVRQTLDNLVAYFATKDDVDEATLRQSIDEAVQTNTNVFQRIDTDENVMYATTRSGFYTEPHIDTTHSFTNRLHEPENPLSLDDLEAVITTTRSSLTTIEPVYISDYWQQNSPVVAPSGADLTAAVEVTPSAEVALAQADVVEVEPALIDADQPQLSSTTVTLDDGTAIDLRMSTEDILLQQPDVLQEAIKQAILNDPLRRIVSFGNEYYAEDAVVSLSKGDLRRIREYIIEQGEPMPDTAILSDVYYKNPRDYDYATFRFALNYRLNREKDFEFVGVEGAHLWSARGLPMVGTKRLKTSELGQFFAYLEEGLDDSLSEMSADDIVAKRQLSRFLTFFEWEYGVLPYDEAVKALLPAPLLPDQRTAVLRIESPQHYTFYLAELRYPTGSRGGWIHGLEAFFKEYLVPGALITLTATEDPSILTITYEETSGREAKLLTLDDKKGRFSFARREFYCDVDDDLVTSQERLPRLKNMKVLPPGERRRITSTAGYVLEQVGQPRPGDTPGFELSLEDLFMGVNIQRPASRAYLRDALGQDEDFLIEDTTLIYFPQEDDFVVEEVATDDEDE